MFEKINLSWFDENQNVNGLKKPTISLTIGSAKGDIDNKEVLRKRLIFAEDVIVRMRLITDKLNNVQTYLEKTISTIRLINENNGNSIASEYPVLDCNIDNSNCTEQEYAIQNSNEDDAHCSKLFLGMSNKPDRPICNSKIQEQKTKDTTPLDDFTQTVTPRRRNVEQEAPRADEDINVTVRSKDAVEQETPRALDDGYESDSSKLEEIMKEETGPRETIGIDQDCRVNMLELQDIPHDENATNLQEIKKTHEQFEANFHLKLEYTPKKENRPQETARLLCDIETSNSLHLKDKPSLEECNANVPGELEDTLLEGKIGYENARKLDAVAVSAPSKLEETEKNGKFIDSHTEGDDTNVFSGSGENLTERMEEETVVKCVEDNAIEFNLVDESSLGLPDDSETATTPNCALKSSPVEIAKTAKQYSTGVARQLLFEWLSGQDGVTRYDYICDEIIIYVKRDDKVTAIIHAVIESQFPQLRDIYRILESDPGVCVPCVWYSYRSERNEPVMQPSEEEILYPGREISCTPFDTGGTKTGTFSGKICGYGVTAGHMVSSESERVRCSEICFESRGIGSPILQIGNVRVPVEGTPFTRETLGDLGFVLLNDQNTVINIFHGDTFNSGSKENFNIVLYRGQIKENDKVMVILRDEKVKFGRIKSVDYNSNVDKVLNTLYIVDENSRALTTDGDSGAIVVLCPNPGDDDLKAIGVVTHLHSILKPEFQGTSGTKHNADNSISVGTIAIRLYDVLVAIQQQRRQEFVKYGLGHEPRCIEFSGPQAAVHQSDSGFQTNRSLEVP